MDCRTFHKHHLAFVDDTLPGADRAAMERHRQACEPCARHDAHVRRGLLVARNLTPIEPSTDFYERLQRRLHDVEPDRSPVYVRSTPRLAPLGRFGGAGTFGTAILGVAASALLAVGVAGWDGGWLELRSGDVATLGTAASTSGDASRAREAATRGGSGAAAGGYRLDVVADPAFSQPALGSGDVEALMLLAAEQAGLDPAMVTSASAGLSVWPALFIADDLPRPFVEAGFSIADLAR